MIKKDEQPPPPPECAYCLDVGRHVLASYGNVLCVDGEKYDLCAEHYRLYAKAMIP